MFCVASNLRYVSLHIFVWQKSICIPMTPSFPSAHTMCSLVRKVYVMNYSKRRWLWSTWNEHCACLHRRNRRCRSIKSDINVPLKFATQCNKKAGKLWLNHFSRLLSVQRLFTARLDPTVTQNDVGLTHVEWSIIPFVFLNSDFALRVNCSPRSESLHILCDESNVFGVRRFITRINTALSLQLGFTVLPNRSRFMYDRESENASGVQAATCLTIMTTIKLRIDS